MFKNFNLSSKCIIFAKTIVWTKIKWIDYLDSMYIGHI